GLVHANTVCWLVLDHLELASLVDRLRGFLPDVLGKRSFEGAHRNGLGSPSFGTQQKACNRKQTAQDSWQIGYGTHCRRLEPIGFSSAVAYTFPNMSEDHPQWLLHHLKVAVT